MNALREMLEVWQRDVIKRLEEELVRLFPEPVIDDFFTPHGPSHATVVEGYLDSLLSESQKRSLHSREIFWLLASVYLHDIGMAHHRDVLSKLEDEEIRQFLAESKAWPVDLPLNIPSWLRARIRALHSLASAAYVREQGDALGIRDGFSRYMISRLCALHTAEWRHDSQDPSLLALERSHKMLSLAALLRLADILHSDFTRIERARLHIEFLAGLPASSWVHWAKHLVLQQIMPKPSDGIIDLLFARPSNLSIDERLLVDDLVRNVTAEIQEEVDRTRDTLHRARLPVYLKVQGNLVENSDNLGPLSPEEERRVRFFLKQYRISRQISASGVRESLLLSIEEIAHDSRWTVNGYDLQVLLPLTSLFEFAYQSYHGNRNIRDLGLSTLEVLRKGKETLEKRQGGATDMIASVKQRVATHLEQIKVATNAQRKRIVEEFVVGLQGALTSDDCILLYSFSTTVAECLGAFCQETQVRPSIMIAECRNKSLGPFADALTYASRLKDLGLIAKEVKLISDASMGFYMTENDSSYFVSKVLLGMGDGWIDEAKGEFFIMNSVGSRMITGLAREFGQRIILVGESSKFSSEQPPAERSRMRSNFGINPREPMVEAFLQRFGLTSLDAVTLDPIQDIIPCSEIHMVISDLGTYARESFGDFVAGLAREIRKNGG